MTAWSRKDSQLLHLYVEDKGKDRSENDGIVCVWTSRSFCGNHLRSYRRKSVNVNGRHTTIEETRLHSLSVRHCSRPIR
jgi:hypothetical protein